VALGGRLRWTDLRMSRHDAPERAAVSGVVLSNWEL
jgi:hypothetical protein